MASPKNGWENNGLVSVIVPTLNSEKYLVRCLDSIKAQTYSKVEIIVVDNFSTDGTESIALRYTTKVYRIGPERSAQINHGFAVATGDYLYRVDSDFVLETGVIEEAVKKCLLDSDAVCIPNISDPTVSFWSKIRNFERNFYVDDDINVAARFFKREVIESVGGFDSSLVAGEDYDLHNRILEKGYRIGFITSTEMHLGEPEHLSDVLRKHYYYGKSIMSFVQKNKTRGIKQLNFIRPAYIRKWKEFVTNPDMAVGLLFYQTTRYTAAFFGMFVQKLTGEDVQKAK